MQHRFVVAFQIVVESSNVALEYGDLTVDENSPVNPDLHFDSQLMHLYVMTEKKVRKSTTKYTISTAGITRYTNRATVPTASECWPSRKTVQWFGTHRRAGGVAVLPSAVCRPFRDKATTKWANSSFGGKTPARAQNCALLLLVVRLSWCDISGRRTILFGLRICTKRTAVKEPPTPVNREMPACTAPYTL